VKMNLQEMKLWLEETRLSGMPTGYDTLRGLVDRFPNGSLTVILDNYHSRRLSKSVIADITDDLMGIIFEKLTPFSANFIKLNDYSMRVPSLNALRVLYEKYASYYAPEEFEFMISVIKGVYPEERWKNWLQG